MSNPTDPNLREWLARAHALDASDLHLESETPVVARVRGDLRVIDEPVAGPRLEQLAKDLLGTSGRAQYLHRGSADLAATIAGVQCRINLFRTWRGTAVAIRLLRGAASDLRSCNLHPDLRRFAFARSGLVILCGPTASGKSTTLAAMIEEINATHARHIITIESPLEYLFTNRRSFIRQREVPTHAPSTEQAVVDALRENPDVLVIGEMRTPDVMRLTLNAAETGHLVITTMHSASCAEALARLCMSFAPELQGSILAQLADCLVAVICQQLDFLPLQQLRVPRCEILTASSATKGTIRSAQFSQLATVIQSGGEQGMWTFDRYRRWMGQKTDWVLPTRSASETLQPCLVISARPASPEAAPGEITIDTEDVDLADLMKKIDGEEL